MTTDTQGTFNDPFWNTTRKSIKEIPWGSFSSKLTSLVLLLTFLRVNKIVSLHILVDELYNWDKHVHFHSPPCCVIVLFLCKNRATAVL